MPFEISERFITLLLRHRGELSRSDIAALPWIEDEEEVELLISILLQDVNVELEQRRVESASIPDWEDVIVLKSNPRKSPLAI